MGGSLPTREREKEERPTASLMAASRALNNESRSRSRSLVAMTREELEAADAARALYTFLVFVDCDSIEDDTRKTKHASGSPLGSPDDPQCNCVME